LNFYEIFFSNYIEKKIPKKSQGRDAEPNRFITLTAEKGKSQIPPNSLSQMLKKGGTKLSMTAYINRPGYFKPAQLPSRRNNS